jgi:hypothetical protein
MWPMAHLAIDPGRCRSRKARRFGPECLLHHGRRQRLSVECFRENALDRSRADVAVEGGAPAGRLCTLDGKLREVRDHRLDLSQLAEHLIAFEELPDDLAHVRTDAISARMPIRAAAMAKGSARLRQVHFIGAPGGLPGAAVRRDPVIVVVDDHPRQEAGFRHPRGVASSQRATPGEGTRCLLPTIPGRP